MRLFIINNTMIYILTVLVRYRILRYYLIYGIGICVSYITIIISLFTKLHSALIYLRRWKLNRLRLSNHIAFLIRACKRKGYRLCYRRSDHALSH